MSSPPPGSHVGWARHHRAHRTARPTPNLRIFANWPHPTPRKVGNASLLPTLRPLSAIRRLRRWTQIKAFLLRFCPPYSPTPQPFFGCKIEHKNN